MAIKQTIPPLIIEPHPKEYVGYPFITLLQFKQSHILCIIDNADNNNIHAYVLDMCGAAGIDEETLINIADFWYKNNSTKYPLAIELSKRGLTKSAQQIYKTFSTEYVSRVIGPLYTFPMLNVTKIKRRRKKQISPSLTKNIIKIF